MKQITKEIQSLEEIKSISLNILIAFDAYCRGHNLKYTLFYGTLLGAIRHEGFIPWDDDIDVAMPRKDYDYLINHFGDKSYGIMECKKNNYYYIPWAKIFDKKTIKKESVYTNKHIEIGINIDVFPIDNIPSKNFYWERKKKEQPIIQKLLLSYRIEYGSNTIIRNIRKIIYTWHRINQNKYCRKIDSTFNNRNPITNYTVSNFIFEKYEKQSVFPKDLFENLIYVSFEGGVFFATKYYDVVLKTIYGDYMTPPPEKDRIPHHTHIAYYK